MDYVLAVAQATHWPLSELDNMTIEELLLWYDRLVLMNKEGD